MIKINKKLSYILVSLVLVIIVIAGNNALTSKGKIKDNKNSNANTVSIFLDDKIIEFSKNPIIKEGKVYVPIEEFSEIIGIESEFKQSEKIILKKDDKNLVINTNDNVAIAEDNSNFFIKTIDKGKKTMLPVDIISKHFGFEISDLSENSIKIYSSSKEQIEVKEEDAKLEDEKNKEKNNNEKNSQDKDEKLEDNDIVESKEEATPPKEKVPEEETKKEEETDPNKKIAYLTFDDGPNMNTPKILDVLKEKGIKATFFMLGSSIIDHKDITKRMNEEGHGLGVHSMTHNFDSIYASPDAFMHEMTITNDLVEEIAGNRTFLLRAPYGSKPYMKQEFRDLATSWGYRIWDWNVDSKDSLKKNTTADEVYNEVVNQVPGKTEAVILFHDKEHTLQALPRIIDFLIENGYEIRKLDKEIQPLNFWNDFR